MLGTIVNVCTICAGTIIGCIVKKGIKQEWQDALMNAMGLALYMPQSGEAFDAYYHTLDEDEDDESYDGRKIGECLSPGIIRKVNSEEETVMQRAVVTVQSAETPRYMGFRL